ESAPEAEAMVRQVGAERWAKACGTVPVASLTITKLAWLARHERATFDRVATVLLPHDYLTYRLTGRLVTDRGDASGTGYWSPAENQWRTDLLDRVVGQPGRGTWADRLPEVLGPNDPSDWMTASVHEILGLRGRPLCGPVGSGGVVVWPYLTGERTPNRPNATGAITGMRGDVTRAQFARAAYEGVVFGLLDGLAALSRVAGVRPGAAGRTFLVG